MYIWLKCDQYMQEIKEEWRDIEGYSGLYQISNLGRVKALGNGNSNNSKERILKLAKMKIIICELDYGSKGDEKYVKYIV